MSDRLRRLLVVVAACAVLVGCGEGTPEPTVVPLLVTVRTDGLALPGAIVRVGSDPRGTTREDGIVRTSASGLAGTAVLVTVDCPDGHHVERPVVPFVLGPPREQLPAARRIDVECARDSAQAVVIVRAAGRAQEPVSIDGRAVAQLDAEGLAHVLVAMAPETRFQVSVGDSTIDSAQRATFTMGVHEDYFFFEAPARAAVHTPRNVRRGPRPRRGPIHKLPTKLTRVPGTR